MFIKSKNQSGDKSGISGLNATACSMYLSGSDWAIAISFILVEEVLGL